MRLNSPIKVYRSDSNKIYGKTLRELADIWYKVAFSKPKSQNPLMGDDIEGKKSKFFIKSYNGGDPEPGKRQLFIAGSVFEGVAFRPEFKDKKVFIKRAVINTNTVILTAIANVILEPGSEHVRDFVKHELNSALPPTMKEAFTAAQHVMKDESATVSFTITGPLSSPKPEGVILRKDNLLFISTPKNSPTTGIKQDRNLMTEPKGQPELFIEPQNPQHHAGWYACFELKKPGTYIMTIDGNVPYAGHVDEKFSNSALYELTVKE